MLKADLDDENLVEEEQNLTFHKDSSNCDSTDNEGQRNHKKFIKMADHNARSYDIDIVSSKVL